MDYLTQQRTFHTNTQNKNINLYRQKQLLKQVTANIRLGNFINFQSKVSGQHPLPLGRAHQVLASKNLGVRKASTSEKHEKSCHFDNNLGENLPSQKVIENLY